MCEIKVQQGSEKWFQARRSVLITASAFGDALGLGRGYPYDFLVSLLSDNGDFDGVRSAGSCWMEHGTKLEPVINEAYELLTGYHTKPTGFWVPLQAEPLYRRIGASPDALVFSEANSESDAHPIGLAEFKAPYFKMYKEETDNSHGIPRHYMAQIQGQMAICGLPWCDFMAVCTATQEVLLKRVFFNPVYWAYVSKKLQEFCHLIEIATSRDDRGLEKFDFPEVTLIKSRVRPDLFPGEKDIVVKNLLSVKTETGIDSERLYYQSLSGHWMNYEFLVGQSHVSPSCMS